VNSLKAGVRLNNNFSFSNVSWGKWCEAFYFLNWDASNDLIKRLNVEIAMRNIIASASMNGSILFWNLDLNSQQKLDKIVTAHTAL
jgi:hypothetical protein